MTTSGPDETLSLSRAAAAAAAASETEAMGILPQLPPTILDALIPGYSVLASTVLTHVGIDISFYVSLCALAFALHAAWSYTVTPLQDYLLKILSSTVIVDEYDDIYDHLLKWVGRHRLMSGLRSIRAESRGRYYDYEEECGDDSSPDEDGVIFNFRQWSARQPPKYEPHTSSGWFYHKGTFYRISRDEKRVQNDWSGMVREKEYLTITCLWRSTQPLKALIDEARQAYIGKETTQTRIYRPAPRELRSDNGEWNCVSARPSRPMSTVVLDDGPKAEILMDVNEFLLPKTATWYANRGVPYRRGYLFHGPPGTGKSSMSFSLAGVFGSNIYCLSLSELSLTEEALIVLFNTLPRRCIVLLEDIDSAGISRPKPPGKEEKGEASSKADKNASKNASKKNDPSDGKAAEEMVVGPAPTKKLTNAISISGLLNAIDGVASSEGRVLIMTTNYPEKLDEALVRPGRVDLKIAFGLASRQQIKELFVRMYRADETNLSKRPSTIYEIMPHIDFDSMDQADEDLQVDQTPRCSASTVNTKASSTSSTAPSPRDTFDAILDRLADEFADILPGDTFSPAEVQGYLLTRKKRPRKAVAELRAWRDEMLAKKNKSKETETEAEKSIPSETLGDDKGKVQVQAKVNVNVNAPPNPQPHPGENLLQQQLLPPPLPGVSQRETMGGQASDDKVKGMTEDEDEDEVLVGAGSGNCSSVSGSNNSSNTNSDSDGS